jgi:uncharacterized protein
MQPLATSWSDADIARLDDLLSSIQEPLQPMDTSAVDGYLCGVLLQPVTILLNDWLPLIFDIDARPAPQRASLSEVTTLVRRRHAELAQAIDARQWFDPWIYEGEDDAFSPVDAQLPWVAGFAAAMDRFPALMALDDPRALEPLAVLYAAFDPEDLEDADALRPIIESLEPPSDLSEAAEDLVRSVLLLADVSRPKRRLPHARSGRLVRRAGAGPDQRRPQRR